MTERTAGPPRTRGAVALILDPMFGALFWGKIFAVIGVWTHGIVAAIAMYDATRSTAMVGLAGVAQFGPQLILSPTSGKWADHGDPARQILLGRLLCVAGSGSTALWLAFVPVALSSRVTIPVLAGSALVGIGFAVGGPAMMSIVPSLLRDGSELSTATALNNIPMTLGRIIGPALGAYLAAHFGLSAGFAATAGFHSVFVLFLLLVRFPRSSAGRSRADGRVRAGLKHVWHDRPLLLALLAVATVGFASDTSITLTPRMAEELNGGTDLVGVLSAAFGVGAAAGMALLAAMKGRLGSVRVSSIGLWLLGAGCVLLAGAATSAAALAGFAAAGMGFGWAITGLTTLVQERAPEELRGRIMALWLVGFLGSRPVAAASLGEAADLLNVGGAFIIAAALIVAMAFLCHPAALDSGC
jgi:MFS family permease